MKCSRSECPQETIIIEVCRVCLVGDSNKNNQTMLSLFEPHQESSIGSQLTALTDVKVSAGDGLPDRICRGCLAELRAALLFRQKCRHSDRQLRGLPSEPAEVKKEEPEEYEDECYLESSSEQEDNVIYKTVEVDIKPVIMKQEEAKTKKDIVSANRHVECHDCGETFKSKCKLRVHWKKNHKKQACEICKRVFQSIKSYNKHQQSRNISCLSVASEGVRIEGEGRTRVFHCSFCDYNTKHIGYMRNHSVVHNSRKPYACDLCPKKFSQKGTLLYHKREVHNMLLESKSGFPCFACGKIFKTRVSARHHSLIHNTQKYQCNLCNKIFKLKQSIIAHLQRHTGVKNYICDICGASFFTQSNLRNHKVAKHRDELFLQTLQCKFCSYIAKSQKSIKKHQKLHSGNNLVCTKLRCGQVFADEHRFRIHEMMHLDGKFHECNLCDERFKRIRNLATHMKNQHKSEENIAFNISVKLEK